MSRAEERLLNKYRRDMRLARMLGDDLFAEEMHDAYSSDPSKAEELDRRATCIWLDEAGRAINPPTPPDDQLPKKS